MKTRLASIAMMVAFVCSGSFVVAGSSTNSVFQKTLKDGIRIEVLEEITEQVSRPIETNSYGTQTRYSDRTHFFRYIIKTNSTDNGRRVWESGESSFKDDLYPPCSILDVHYSVTNLAILYRARGYMDLCDIVDLSKKTSLAYQQIRLLPETNLLQQQSHDVQRLPGTPRITKSEKGAYQVVTEERRDFGAYAYDPARRMTTWKPRWETNNIVLQFTGQSWELVSTNLWAKPNDAKQ